MSIKGLGLMIIIIITIITIVIIIVIMIVIIRIGIILIIICIVITIVVIMRDEAHDSCARFCRGTIPIQSMKSPHDLQSHSVNSMYLYKNKSVSRFKPH